MAQVHEKERELQREVADTVRGRLPGVEVLAVEMTGPDRMAVYIDHPDGVDHALCERVTGRPARLPRPLHARRCPRRASSARCGRGRTSPTPSGDASRPHVRQRGRTQALSGRGRGCERAEATIAVGGEQFAVPYASSCGGISSRKEGRRMSREIIEAVREIEKREGDRGRDARPALSRMRSSPPTRRRRVRLGMHRSSSTATRGDFRVFSIELPADIEERLVEEARERAIAELEQAEIENGERSHTLIRTRTSIIDWSGVPRTR